MQKQDRIVVVGCGEIGLSLAIALAVHGFDVCGYDVDGDKVRACDDGRLGINDHDLSAGYAEARASGRLRFVGSLAAEHHPRCFVVAVPTPVTDAEFDSRALDAAIATISAVARHGDAIIIRSTVPVGTTQSLARILAEADLDADIACCPDRTVSGRTYAELFEIPHIVSGINERSRARAAGILSQLGPVVEVGSLEIAEAIKLFANVQRAAIFGLANEYALICEQLGLDIYGILEASAKGYPRHILPRPGPVGGPCLTKDASLLVASLPEFSPLPQITLAARAVNQGLLDHARGAICEHLAALDRASPVVAILGVAFKGHPPTADTRESFAVALGHRLRAVRPAIEIRAWDPEVAPLSLSALGMNACDDPISVATNADVVVFANDHPALAQINPAALAAVTRKPALFYDLCGVQRGCAGALPLSVALRVHGVGCSRRSAFRSEAV